MPQRPPAVVGRQLYTPEERIRRDRSRWTVVQGVLAPLQLLAFLVSLWLVLSFLRTGDGATAATVSVIVKTAFLYAINASQFFYKLVLARRESDAGENAKWAAST